VRRYPYPHPFAAGTIGETVSPVGRTLLGDEGAACAEIVDRATKPAQVAMMMTRTNVRSWIEWHHQDSEGRAGR
jgi:hypothetical protein